jgi:NADH-quinone oxidoreductase subunit L
MTLLGPVYTLLQHKYYLDDIYWRGIVKPIRDPVSAGVYRFDQKVIDGIVNGAASLTRGFSSLVGWFDRSVIDGIVNGIGTVTSWFGRELRLIQTGNAQWYIAGLFVGVLALAFFFIEVV